MEKKLRKVVFPLFLLCWVWTLGCKPKKEEKASRISATEEGIIKDSQPSTHQNRWVVVQDGDSTRQKYQEGGITYFESLLVKEKRIYNTFYPLIQDAFLFEDKFYLKTRFPLDYSGEIEFTFPEYPDYVLTKIGDQAYQLVINNALDLNHVLFDLHYLPSETDSLVRTDYSFTHVVFEE
ncbi:hypothetical protein [Cyclobacterium jeungdonense]|uniref:Lipoprotein n=1 Tax=Cyclobacterium jeungdonense TaxID=708087 RepID=A0ABT8CD10_9BACT|nr:hypothetical protein [Cyclobacterium jeungdonense]MDN3689688.1 hypothetical protein [Cyclobacterium jeungdonense]